jgi:hypothetical protein
MLAGVDRFQQWILKDKKMVAKPRIELGTQGFSGLCSTG